MIRQRIRFTLVEMLVVVSIIAILAALLMPGLNRALESGRGIACVNNLKQVGMAIFSYADNYAGFFPNHTYAASRNYAFPNGWVAEGRPLAYLTYQGYLQGFQKPSRSIQTVTTCPTYWPADAKRDWGNDYYNIVYIRGGSYSFNSHVDNSLMYSRAGGVPLVNFYSLRRPSQRFLYGEGTWVQCRIYSSEQIWYGHNGGSNFEYVDGHVAALSPDRVFYNIDWPATMGRDTTLRSPW